MKKCPLLIFLLIVVSCVTTKPNTVAVIGDSITFVSTAKIKEKLSGYDVSVTGVLGARTDQRQDQADMESKSNPYQVVIELGTNDIGQDIEVIKVQTELNKMLSKFNSHCKHLVTLTESTLDPRVNHQATQLNDWMRNKDGVKVIDWGAFIKANPDRNLTSDFIHPNDDGQSVLTDLIKHSLDSCS